MEDQHQEMKLSAIASSHTCAIGPVPLDLAGKKEVSTREAAAKACKSTGVVISGEWEGKRVCGIATAGHVSKLFEESEVNGVLVLGRSRDNTMRDLAVVKVIHVDTRLGGRFLLKDHREVYDDDMGFIWLDNDGMETIRSKTIIPGYNPGKKRVLIDKPPRMICVAGNNEFIRKTKPHGSPPEIIYSAVNISFVNVEDKRDDGTYINRRIVHLVQIDNADTYMGGTSGSGIWVECRTDQGEMQAVLIGIVGSHLHGWSHEGKDNLLIQPVNRLMNWLFEVR